MPKPVCIACQCFFKPKKNGYAFIEGMPNSAARPGDNIRGKRQPESWDPYKVWMGDLWECPDCGAEVVIGCGVGPVAEHYQPDFQNRATVFGATVQINDC